MPKTVLIADDNAGIRKALCQMFEVEGGYEICAEATNGEEAIAFARKHKPDLIILDLSMPVMNGLDAARKLKRIMPEVPIILFTSHASAVTSAMEEPAINRVVSKGDVDLMDCVRALLPV